jgi:hypothetical protein
MKMLFKDMIFLMFLKSANAKLHVPRAEGTHEDSLFWSRHLMSTNPGDFKPEPKMTSFGSITEGDITTLQKSWGDAMVSISKTYEENGLEEAKVLAKGVFDSAFCDHLGVPALFKPMQAMAPPQTFRTSEDRALAYVVGDNPEHANGKGFNLKGWEKVEAYPESVLLLGNTALSQGYLHLTDRDGNITIIEKAWGYLKEDDGNICVIMHYSLPC